MGLVKLGIIIELIGECGVEIMALQLGFGAIDHADSPL
jgi:hypothetical protein